MDIKFMLKNVFPSFFSKNCCTFALANKKLVIHPIKIKKLWQSQSISKRTIS